MRGGGASLSPSGHLLYKKITKSIFKKSKKFFENGQPKNVQIEKVGLLFCFKIMRFPFYSIMQCFAYPEKQHDCITKII